MTRRHSWIDAQGHRFSVWLRAERGPRGTSHAMGMLATGPGVMASLRKKVGRAIVLDDGSRVLVWRIRRGSGDRAFADCAMVAAPA